VLLVSGDTHETTRDILQAKLMGGPHDKPETIGTGLIPGRAISGYVKRPGVTRRHGARLHQARRQRTASCVIWFRSYEQGRVIFQGFELDGFWPDEECPQDVYEEGQVRLMTTHGLSTLTFTPLEGLTELVSGIMSTPDEQRGRGPLRDPSAAGTTCRT
jgi:phage terminase large subunit-like protein